MDKKDKKHLDVLHQRQQKLQQQLAGARRQADDPSEIQQLERELISVQQAIDQIKLKEK